MSLGHPHHMQRFRKAGRHRLLGDHVCTCAGHRFGHLAVAGVLRAKDDDVKGLLIQHLPVVTVDFGNAGHLPGPSKVGSSGGWFAGEGPHSRDCVGTSHPLDVR